MISCLIALCLSSCVLANSHLTSKLHHQSLQSIDSRLTPPVITSLSSPSCLSIPGQPTRLVNCSLPDNEFNQITITINAKNVYNESLMVEVGDSYGDPYWEAVDFTWNQFVNHSVQLVILTNSFASMFRLEDHNKIGSHVNQSIEMNFCSNAMRQYSIDIGNLTNIIQCGYCPPGSYVDPDNPTMCVACNPESFLSKSGACEACPIGQFQPNVSSTTCHTCADRPDMPECQMGNINEAILLIVVLSLPLIACAVVMFVLRQRALGNCRSKRDRRLVDCDDADHAFLYTESQANLPVD